MTETERYIYEALKKMKFRGMGDLAFIQDKSGAVVFVTPREEIYKKIEDESN